jgi:GWxTD domain-containing protein
VKAAVLKSTGDIFRARILIWAAGLGAAAVHGSQTGNTLLYGPVFSAQLVQPQGQGGARVGDKSELLWREWINEDVTYIITDDERKALKQLNTDEERQQFIEQFWLRRDPTPATIENEFKEEHYRRIAYVNELYGWSGIPGWKTDRGRICITYGPPDEIDSHPFGGTFMTGRMKNGAIATSRASATTFIWSSSIRIGPASTT